MSFPRGKRRANRRYSGPERRIAKPSFTLICAAGLSVLAIAFATLCPIGLRPRLGPPDVERFSAFFVLGLILSQTAPRKPMLVLAFMVLLAFGLEGAQLMVPGRDGRFPDACVKATGGVLGAQLGLMSFAIRRWVFDRIAANIWARLAA
jgi:hypothetical protein